MTTFAIIIAIAGVVGFPFIMLIGAALRASSSLSRSAARTEVTASPGGGAAATNVPRWDAAEWREQLIEFAAHSCEFDDEGRPCPLVPGLDRETWCVNCLSATALGLPVVSVPSEVKSKIARPSGDR